MQVALMYGHYDAGLRVPELVAILTSEHAMPAMLAETLESGADVAWLALYQDKFRRNVEFFGRILMASCASA